MNARVANLSIESAIRSHAVARALQLGNTDRSAEIVEAAAAAIVRAALPAEVMP